MENSDRITDKQLADLIEWHSKDGTPRGELTTKALNEIADMRQRLAMNIMEVSRLNGKLNTAIADRDSQQRLAIRFQAEIEECQRALKLSGKTMRGLVEDAQRAMVAERLAFRMKPVDPTDIGAPHLDERS